MTEFVYSPSSLPLSMAVMLSRPSEPPFQMKQKMSFSPSAISAVRVSTTGPPV